MYVWVVGQSGCESNSVMHLCESKTLAEKRIFELRDTLVKEWEEAEVRNKHSIADFCETHGKEIWVDDMYTRMIEGVQDSDYKKWSSYPHDTPYMYQMKVEQ